MLYDTHTHVYVYTHRGSMGDRQKNRQRELYLCLLHAQLNFSYRGKCTERELETGK